MQAESYHIAERGDSRALTEFLAREGCRRHAQAEAARLMPGAGVSRGRREFAGGISRAVTFIVTLIK